MARKKVETLPRLRSWEEVDQALRQVLECESCVDEINVELNRQVAEAREEADRRAQEAVCSIKRLSADIRDFVVSHRDEISGKTKQLNFGCTGFRVSTSLVVPPGKAADIICNLRQHGMNDCINVKETVNKEVLKKYKSEDILKVGAYMKSVDEFWYEVDKERLKPAEQ